MRSIRRRIDIAHFLTEFRNLSCYDSFGKKHYFIFDDFKRNGQWTLMLNYKNQWSLHGKGEHYCDESELFMKQEEIELFIWKNRKAINNSLKLTSV